jgi:hypothetical protein
MNNTLEYMKKNGVPLTRENYLDYTYLGNPPEELSGEEAAEIEEALEATLPDEISKDETE